MELIKKITYTTATLSDTVSAGGTPVLTYAIDYPVFTSRQYAPAARTMNAYYELSARGYEAHVKTALTKAALADYKNSIKNGYPVHEYEVKQVFDVTYDRNCAVSLYQDRYEYTGGAHGTTARTSQTWSLLTGKQLPLRTLFPENKHYKEDLKQAIDTQIAQQIENGTGAYFDDYKKLVQKTFDPKSYYLTPENLVIYFQQYDIAPYASGIPTFPIPYDAVGASLPHC